MAEMKKGGADIRRKVSIRCPGKARSTTQEPYPGNGSAVWQEQGRKAHVRSAQSLWALLSQQNGTKFQALAATRTSGVASLCLSYALFSCDVPSAMSRVPPGVCVLGGLVVEGPRPRPSSSFVPRP